MTSFTSRVRRADRPFAGVGRAHIGLCPPLTPTRGVAPLVGSGQSPGRDQAARRKAASRSAVAVVIGFTPKRATTCSSSAGVRNAGRLGPTLPAFLTPALLDILVSRFGILPITNAEDDIAHALQRQAA